MAIRDTSAAVGALSFKDKLPAGRYTIRCIDSAFGPSKSSGNPMITLSWEVVAPERVNINGTEKVIAGIKMDSYHTTINLGANGKRDDAKSEASLARLSETLKALQLPTTIDDENPDLTVFNGIVAEAVLDSDENTLKAKATPEQLAQGIKFGEDVLDDNGAPIKTYRPKISNILKRSTTAVGVAH